MLKKITTFAIIVLAFFGCKKDKNPSSTPFPDISGNWALYSSASTGGSYGTGLTYTASVNPCLADNILSISKSGATSAYYTGNETCFVDTNNVKQYFFAIGVPGQDTIFGTWSAHSNVAFFTSFDPGGPQYSYGRVKTVNGKVELTVSDTVNGTARFIYTNVYIKQ